MNDIIKHAKRLLKGATRGPWELINGEIYQIQHTPKQCTRLRCDHRWPVLSENWGESAAVAADEEDLALMASARENTEALASEYWMFAVQVYIGKRWIFLGRGHSFNSLEEHACWFTSVDKARAFLAAGYESTASKYPMKLVHQRRSPVEDWTANDA